MKQKTTKQLVQDLGINVKGLRTTVKDLGNTLQNLTTYTIKGYAEINQRVDNLEDKMATKEGMDKVYQLADKIAGELKDMRIEQSAHTIRHDDIDKDLEAIKTIPVIAHELKKN